MLIPNFHWPTILIALQAYSQVYLKYSWTKRLQGEHSESTKVMQQQWLHSCWTNLETRVQLLLFSYNPHNIPSICTFCNHFEYLQTIFCFFSWKHVHLCSHNELLMYIWVSIDQCFTLLYISKLMNTIPSLLFTLP